MSITVAANNTRYSSEDGVLFNKKGDTLMLYPPNKPQDAYTVPSSVTVIGGDNVFHGGRARPRELWWRVGNGAFGGCRNLKSVTIPGNVKAIGDGAFLGCVGLRSVAIENGVTVIGIEAFSGCVGLTSVTIPGSVASIERGAFLGCVNLASATIEEGVKTIGEKTFAVRWSYSNLMSVTIPSSVTSIGDSAFFECANMGYITCLNPIPPDISEKPFDGLSPDACLYVPKNSVDAYRAAIGWNRFKCVKPIADASETVADSLPAQAKTLSLWARLRSGFLRWPSAGSSAGYVTDGYYKTVKIGKQTWMAENLNYGGSYYCYNRDASNCKTYGELRDWESAQNACPSGWHLPSRAEWRELADATGDRRIAGNKLKSKAGWNDDGGGKGTDEFGFSAMPGGRRDYNGVNMETFIDTFYDAGSVGYWWSADGYDKDRAYGRYMNNRIDGVHEGYYDKQSGFSVRCVKDRSDK
jgi:uncharacterized protein (TIGR02145 family)